MVTTELPFTGTVGTSSQAYAAYTTNTSLSAGQRAASFLSTATPTASPDLKPWQTFADRLNDAQLSRAPATGISALNSAAPASLSSQTAIGSHDLNSARAASLVNLTTPLETLNQHQITPSPSDPATTAPFASSESSVSTYHLQTPEEKKARKVAGDLVANALILPLLKQNRRSVWNQNNIFKGGAGENAFGPEFDTQLADRVAHSPSMGLTDALTKQLLAKRSHAATKTASPNSGVDVHG